jgi:hypothetical protein
VAAARLREHQALGAQPRERGPHGGLGDAEARAELLLGHGGPRRQLEPHERAAQARVRGGARRVQLGRGHGTESY